MVYKHSIIATASIMAVLLTVSTDAWILVSPSRLLQRTVSPRTRLSMTATQQQEPILPTLVLYNSKSRSKEPLCPLEPNHIKMYTCGPTIYDSAHVGNFRAFLTYDVVKRVLLYFGYSVQHVCNLTDVDD